ncbi:MAG: methyltransferase domain-containing protein [Byssovorax sp.]
MPLRDRLPSLSTLKLLLEQRARRLVRPARLGTLRRTSPLSDAWGFDRGTPIDRHYIDRFLGAHQQDIRGRLLEVRDTRYAERFGPPDAPVDVLDIDPENWRATILADLAAADAIPSERFDCFLLVQTLQYIRDVPAALRHTRRILRPGGVVLAVVPGVQRSDPAYLDGDYWRFTRASCQALFGEAFGASAVTVTPYGNVLSCIASLSGLAAQELRHDELTTSDPSFPVYLFGVRAEYARPTADDAGAPGLEPVPAGRARGLRAARPRPREEP